MPLTISFALYRITKTSRCEKQQDFANQEPARRGMKNFFHEAIFYEIPLAMRIPYGSLASILYYKRFYDKCSGAMATRT
jgi:hypothetical protein